MSCSEEVSRNIGLIAKGREGASSIVVLSVVLGKYNQVNKNDSEIIDFTNVNKNTIV